jgi:hypothetical protein
VKKLTYRGTEIMAYKYESILKTFEYSKDSYQIISDFLLSGDITNPNVMLNVTKVSKEFGKEPKHWFQRPSTKELIITLIEIQCEDQKRRGRLKKAIESFLKEEDIPKVRKSYLCKNSEFIELLKDSKYQLTVKFAKKIGLIIVKRGNAQLTKSESGTWIHKDLAIKYAEWLDPKFSIWISQKINELISDGVAWNKIRLQTRIDYKPLTDAVEKYILPKYPKMNENIVYGKIANYINCRVMGKKAKEIREEKGIEPYELTRDHFTEKQLQQIEKVQVFAEMLISQLDLHDFKSLEEKISNFRL